MEEDNYLSSFASFNNNSKPIARPTVSKAGAVTRISDQKTQNIQQSHLLKMKAGISGQVNHQNQNLQEVPRELVVAQFKDITGLNLSNNLLVMIPDSLFSCLSNLLSLNLENNKLNQLSSSIRRLKRLTELNLNSNCLNYLPQELGELH